MPVETITDADALGVQQEIDSTPDEARRAQLAQVLLAYRQQQADAGKLEFEATAREQAKRDQNVRRMFSDPGTLGLPKWEADALTERVKVSPNPEGEKKVYANTVWIAHRTGQPYQKIAENYLVFRDDFADQFYGGAGKGDDSAFYAATKQKIDFEETVNEAAQAGARAAIEGQNRLEALSAVQFNRAGPWQDEHTQAFVRRYDEAAGAIEPHRELVTGLVDQLGRSMKGEAKPEDAAAIEKAKETLVDMPVAERRAVLAALAAVAQKAGKEAEKAKGGDMAGDAFNPVAKPIRGWLQQAGESGFRFVERGLGSAAGLEDAIQAIPEEGKVALAGRKLETPEQARAFVMERAREAHARTAIGTLPGAAGMPAELGREPDTVLTPAQSALIRSAKARAKRELVIEREIQALAEAADPVKSLTASAFGTSAAAMGTILATRGASIPVMAGMYANIEYDQLRRDYPEMSHGDARQIAMVSGLAQSALDLVGFRALERLPGVKSFLSQPVTKVLLRRAALRGLGTQLTETGVEVAQDFSTGLTQAAFAAFNNDIPGRDWSKELNIWQSAGNNFIAMLPLTLLGVGAASVQEMRGARELLNNHDALGRAGVRAPDRVKIVDLAAQGKAEEAQAALVEANERRSPAVAKEFGGEQASRQVEAENALADALRLGLMPRVVKTEAGYTITDPGGTSVTVQDREQAVALATAHADEIERARVGAITEAFEAISRGEDILDFDPARKEGLKAGVADRSGAWTEEEATQAAIVQGVLNGMSAEEAQKVTWAVMGSNAVERTERVRDGVATLVNISRSKLNAGANVLTAVEEAVHGNWTRGLREGHWTAEEGLKWVRLGEQLLNEELLPMSDADALGNERAMSEAISALVVADAVGRRKDGSRVVSGAVSRGLVAEMQRAKQADRGAVGKLRQFLRAWRELFAQVFRRARALGKARKEGKITGDFDTFLDRMLGADAQARHERGVAREVEEMSGEKESAPFSLAPRDLLERVSTALQSRIRKPEAREAFYKLAKAKLDKLRAGAMTWRGDPIEGLDDMAERDRSIASLNREAKVRLRMRQRELIEEGMGKLSRSTLDALHSDEALADARENPVIAHLLSPDPKTPGGWSGRLRHPSRADKNTINEYDDMPEGLPGWFMRGNMAPDLAAQELYDARLINEPTPSAMWSAIDSAFKTAWGMKAGIKAAQDAVRKIERDAYAQARAEADKWLEGARAAIPSQKEKMMAALRMMDAIASAFPEKVRGSLGGMTKLASMGSDKGRLKVILEKLDKFDEVVEKHLKELYYEDFTKLLERAKPTGEPGEGVKGRIGAPAHEWFAAVQSATEMTREEADERLTAIEALLAEPDLTQEREAELVEEYLVVQQFGAFATRSSAEMESALLDARAVYERGRDSWLAVLEERKKLHASVISQGVREVGNAGKLTDQSKGGEARRQSPLSWAADKFIRQIWTWRQTLEATMNRDSAVAVRFHDLARKATREERDAVLKREEDFKNGLRDEVLPGKDRRARNRWLHDLLQPSRDISILEGVRTEKMEVPVAIARAVVDSANTLAGHDFSDLDAARLEIMLAENDALPAQKKKDVLRFERIVHGGTRGKVKLSEAEAIHVLMTWAQPEYRAGLELHGFDAEAMDEVRDAITPEGYRLMDWLRRQYAEGYEPLNSVHARVRGVSLPRVENYAPGVFDHDGNVSEMALDSPHLQNGNLRNGFTKRRKPHLARLRMDFEQHSINAVSLYWNHVAQTEHWKAWVEAVNEFKAVLRNRDLRGAVLAAHGQEAVHSLNGWLELFENGGLRNGWESLQQARWINRLMRAKARVSLILRLPVYLVQSTASLTALLDLPVKAGLKSLARVMSGQGRMSVKEALSHPVIQRRMRGGFSPEARIAKAAKSGSAGRLEKASEKALEKVGLHTTDIENALEWGMETIGWTDALFTSVSAATAYDAHYSAAESLGMKGKEAEAYALEKMEETVQRTAQPVEGLDRSLLESSPNGFLRLMMMFTSEPRQKVALELAAIRQAMKGEGSKAEAARMVFMNHLMLGTSVWLVRSIARDLLNDDDDDGLEDPAWEAEDWLVSVMLGPFSGLPLLGDAAEWLTATVAGRRQFQDAQSPAVGPLKDVYQGTKALLKPPKDEEIEHYAKAIGKLARGVAMGVSGNAAALGVAENVMEQVFQLGDNVISE